MVRSMRTKVSPSVVLRRWPMDTKNYKVVEFSWTEKRQDLFDGVDTLPEPLRTEARTSIEALTPKEPQLAGAKAHPPEQTLETEHFLVALDPATGAIRQLHNKTTGADWADPAHPLALLTYQTLSPADYSRFFANYIVSTADWAKKDFGKPNIERFGAESREWHPAVTRLDVAEDGEGHHLMAQLAIHDPESVAAGRASFPESIFLELMFPRNEPVVQIEISWFRKPATRMPEALWLTFNPRVADPRGWTMDKSGETISPLDVVAAGSRHLHAVYYGLRLPIRGTLLAHRDPRCASDRRGRALSAELLARAARSIQRHPLQPLQQCVGNELHHVVRREHALPVCGARVSWPPKGSADRSHRKVKGAAFIERRAHFSADC